MNFIKTSFRSLPGLRLRSELLFLTPHDVADLSASLLDVFGKKNHFSTECLHFARVTFRFSARGQSARKVSADIGAVSGRTFQGLVETRAVLAGVAEKPLKNRLVAQAAQMASGQPEKVRSTLLYDYSRLLDTLLA